MPSHAEALAWLEQGFAVAPDDQDLLWILCRLHLRQHQIPEAESALARLK